MAIERLYQGDYVKDLRWRDDPGLSEHISLNEIYLYNKRKAKADLTKTEELKAT